jgi:hypothetical protein
MARRSDYRNRKGLRIAALTPYRRGGPSRALCPAVQPMPASGQRRALNETRKARPAHRASQRLAHTAVRPTPVRANVATPRP